jgi:hypothetical protein
MKVIKNEILTPLMPNHDRERTTTFEIISLAHYVASMAIILTTSP